MKGPQKRATRSGVCDGTRRHAKNARKLCDKKKESISLYLTRRFQYAFVEKEHVAQNVADGTVPPPPPAKAASVLSPPDPGSLPQRGGGAVTLRHPSGPHVVAGVFTGGGRRGRSHEWAGRGGRSRTELPRRRGQRPWWTDTQTWGGCQVRHPRLWPHVRALAGAVKEGPQAGSSRDVVDRGLSRWPREADAGTVATPSHSAALGRLRRALRRRQPRRDPPPRPPGSLRGSSPPRAPGPLAGRVLRRF